MVPLPNFVITLLFSKHAIEKEGLPRDSTPDLGAGGPRFKSGRPDQFMFFVSHHLETPAFFLNAL
jgi:hypothetical protein